MPTMGVTINNESATSLNRVPTVREKSGENEKKFKVREKSGNFKFSQGNLEFRQKSGKSQEILEFKEIEGG